MTHSLLTGTASSADTVREFAGCLGLVGTLDALVPHVPALPLRCPKKAAATDSPQGGLRERNARIALRRRTRRDSGTRSAGKGRNPVAARPPDGLHRHLDGGGGTLRCHEPANWDVDTLPTADDRVCIPAGAPGSGVVAADPAETVGASLESEKRFTIADGWFTVLGPSSLTEVDRRSVWFAGIARDRRPFVAYVEDNGEPGTPDVFRRWIAGAIVTPESRVLAGNLHVHQ